MSLPSWMTFRLISFCLNLSNLLRPILINFLILLLQKYFPRQRPNLPYPLSPVPVLMLYLHPPPPYPLILPHWPFRPVELPAWLLEALPRKKNKSPPWAKEIKQGRCPYHWTCPRSCISVDKGWC